MASFLLPVKLGQPVSRRLPDDVLPYVNAHEWQTFCDAFDRLSLNPIDKNGTLLMRLSLTIAVVCLVLVILFGYFLDPSGDSSSSDEEGGDDEDKDDGTVSTALVVVTAIPICFPFVMAAVLNCHTASTISKLLDLCRTSSVRWVTSKTVTVTVEQIQSVSNQDEVIDKFLIQFDPLPPTSKDLETGSAALYEASPEAAKK